MNGNNIVGDGWSDRKFVQEYSAKASDPTGNWYEHEVNLPPLFALMPFAPARILDYGCNTGYVTATLNSMYGRCDGCDYSETSIAVARQQYPDLDFFVWDGKHALNDREEFYGTIFAKLTLNYVKNLSSLVASLNHVLQPGVLFWFQCRTPCKRFPRSPANISASQLISTKWATINSR